jgi:UV DNA damage endonuclease
MELSSQGISTNRGMIKKTFQSKGIKYAGELAEKNLEDLLKVLEWNHKNDIRVYRMSSCLFPWMSEYEFSELPNFEKIKKLCEEVGNFAENTMQRLSFHPGHFVILASQSETTLKNALKDLDRHAQIMDLMNLREDDYNTINIHVGGVYGDKESALKRFCQNFEKLQSSARNRLTVENDDKANMYSVRDLYHGVHEKIGIPIVFDYHHHRMCSGDCTEEEALKLASLTWKSKQLVHYSSSKKLNEDQTSNHQAHADYVYEKIDNYGMEIDVEVEAKMKEIAVKKYLQEYY